MERDLRGLLDTGLDGTRTTWIWMNAQRNLANRLVTTKQVRGCGEYSEPIEGLVERCRQ